MKVDTSEVVRRNGTTGLTVLSAALYMSSVADFLVNCHELQQEWFHCHQDVLDMKKTTDAISGIASKESVRVALLQTLGEDGVISLR